MCNVSEKQNINSYSNANYHNYHLISSFFHTLTYTKFNKKEKLLNFLIKGNT